MTLDPYTLDRAITAASRTLAAARESLRDDPEGTSPRPLARHDGASRRDALIEVHDLAGRRADEPLWAAAVPWMQALTLARATFVDERREAIARRAARHRIEEPVRGEVTVHEALLEALTARTPAVVRAWTQVVEASSAPTRVAAVFRVQRRTEAARLLEGVELDRLDVPVDEASLVARTATEVLAITDGVVPSSPTWRDALVVTLARDGQEGYPAKLTARWMAEVLPPGLFAGLAFDPGPGPRLLGASSVARALADVGARAAELDVPAGLPRCLARAPSDLLVVRRAALLGSLVADPVFVRRALGASRAAATEQAGGAARALVLALRVTAAKALLRGASSPDELIERGGDHFGAALGTAFPATLVGVVPRLDPGCGGDGRPSAAAELIGAVVAAADRESLVEALDEDWFMNPRAADVLRHAHHQHRASVRATGDDVEAGLAALRRALATI